MNNRQRAHDRRRGSVMFAALAVVLTITVLASCLLQLSTSTAREQTQSIDTKRAFYLAESGLSEAWYGLKIGKSGNIGTAQLPASYGDGLLWVEAEDIGGGRTNLTSTGLVGSGRFSLSMVVEREGTTVTGMGFFADEDVSIGQGVLVDSYNSASGPYVAATVDPVNGAGELLGLDGLTDPVQEIVVGAGSTSRVGSNGDIYVNGSAEQPTLISGDVQPGPSGSVIQGEGVTIAGSTAPASKPFELPGIEVPPLLSKGDMTVGARGSLSVLPPGEAAYGVLRVPAGRTLTVQGPATLVVSHFRLDSGGSLVLDAATGPITIHVTHELSWAPQSNVACTHSTPDKLSLLVSASEPFDRDGDGVLDSPAQFQATGAWLGTVYAPHSPLQVAAETEVFGAIAARSLQLSDGAKLHFDEALAVAQTGADAQLVVTAWRVIDLPDVPLVNDRKDPVLKLLIDGVVAPLASEAHETVLFKIKFIEWDDEVEFWQGDESKFNWLEVKSVVEIAREGDVNFDALRDD